MANPVSGSFPVNENGEILLQSGTGSNNKVSNLPSNQIPHNDTTDKMVVKLPVETATFTSDALGLVSPLGTAPVKLKNSGLKVVLWGDSGMGNSASTASVTALGQATHVNGLVTFPFNGHNGYVGEPVYIVNSEDIYWYGKHTITALPDTNTIQFNIDPRAASDVFSTKPVDGIATPALIVSHQIGKNNPALQSMMMAGIIPADFVNLGANTQTALSMAWHIERDLVDYSDFDLWICATVGANDVRANGGTGNLQKALTNSKARLLRLKSAGKRVLFLGWMPNDTRDASKNSACLQDDGVTLYSPATDNVSKACTRFNQEMTSWCRENGIDVISQFSALVDPTSTSAYAVTGTNANYLLADGVHVGKRGARQVGNSGGKAWFQTAYPGSVLPLPSSLMDRKHDTSGAVVNPTSNYIFRNPLLLTVSGTAGLAADAATSGSFGMPAAASFSLNARTVATDGDTYGNNQRATFSTTGTAAEQAGNITLTIPAADIKLGGKIRVCAHVQFTSLASFEGYRMYIQVVTTNYGTITSESTLSKGTATDVGNFDDTDSIKEYPFTPWVYIPADAIITSALCTVQGFVKCVSGAGTAGFTVDIGRPGIDSRSI